MILHVWPPYLSAATITNRVKGKRSGKILTAGMTHGLSSQRRPIAAGLKFVSHRKSNRNLRDVTFNITS